MSSETAQAPSEDTTFSSAIANDLPPNTHTEAATSVTSNTYGMFRQLYKSSRSVRTPLQDPDWYDRFCFVYREA